MPEFVDVEALVLSLLPYDLDSGTQLPSNVPYPFIAVRKIDGASPDARFYDQADVRIDVYATSRDEAYSLAQEIRSIIWGAWDTQEVTPYGHISWLEELQSPAQHTTEHDPDGIWTFRAVYDLTIRGDGK